ncbi:5-(carboxyamino)imidazole ribonucleotide synthase [Candidatus Mesenet endosymbiont of Agriotes lineatus]|uniref:5-(carboxyamino)imidazole ribonucleotide synthase n=1 Tax=Candidatus Mesenet endosymbiont of Agriotes lineatus TaxID=3077948 RepID=UPI0030CB55CC
MYLDRAKQFIIGIMGGGQLGKMIAGAAAKFGIKTHVFTDDKDSPASHITSNLTIADFTDKDALISFAKNVDLVTLEFENIPCSAIDILLQYTSIYPGKKSLYIAQNRLREKGFMEELKIQVPKYWSISNYTELQESIKNSNFPLILKEAEMGYDGKGQYVIQSDSDVQNLYNLLNWEKEYILEELVDIQKEISLIVARDKDKNTSFFPIAENFHVNGILDRSVVTAKIDSCLTKQAQKIVEKIVSELELVGILAVEFFITKDGSLLVNEIAPRPHNSGHWSLDACNVSQFEQLVRAICGFPLQEVKLHFPCTTKNILGTDINNCFHYLSNPNASLTIYGKEQAKGRRKMGHVNIINT